MFERPLKFPLVHLLREQSWLRHGELSVVIRRSDEDPNVPRPKGKLRSLDPVTWYELAEVVASYNAWARLWNHHDETTDLPFSPHWWDGRAHADARHVTFLLNDGRRLELEMSKTWSAFQSSHRSEVGMSDVAWAGWARCDE